MIGLLDLLKLSEVSPVRVSGDASFSGIVADSRKDVRGKLFVCMPSEATDTHGFIVDVALRGASAVIVHGNEGFEIAVRNGLSCLQLESDLTQFNRDLGILCREFYSDPTLDVRVFGITGTNGKTTCAWMLRQALRALGREAGYLGTLGYMGAGELEELPNTTPFPVELWELLNRARSEGITDLIMEVSSHSLHQNRVSGVRFDVGVFTNLSQDHLDYHHTMEEYADAKKLLFTKFAEATDDPFVAVVNSDDPVGAEWLAEWDSQWKAGAEMFVPPFLSYGLHSGSVRGEVKEVSFDHLILDITALAGTSQVTVAMGGDFNVQNALTVFAVLQAVGVAPADATEAMKSITAVPGRFEAVANNRGIGIIVDYAHTDDAMEKLLSSAKALPHQRIICVFGCGGDRDRTKRPKMAAVSSRLADLTILTSDNPRTEDPGSILKDVEAGIVQGANYIVVPDRREAIETAIDQAEPGDLVVIAGKGHETYQIIGREKTPFDDREVARQSLRAKGSTK